MSSRYDILMVADPRFSGGTSSALIADTEAFLNLGAQIGLMFVTSDYLGEADLPHQAVLMLADHADVTCVPAEGTVEAETVFLHHPLIFFHGIKEQVQIVAPRSVLVAHQAPFRGNDTLEYDPLRTAHRIKNALGLTPLWAPISGLCRAQLTSFAPLIRLTSEDWINTFDTSDWTPQREVFADSKLVIGRHGREDYLKWPDNAAAIAACLPAGSRRQIRVMGCPTADLETLGADLSAWEIVPYGAEPVPGFLDSLDVFSYFYHPRWVETFGRTVAEAALMGRVLVLTPALEATFGDIAFYPQPDEVSGLLDRLTAEPTLARVHGAHAREVALKRYASTSIADRLQVLKSDRGTVSRCNATQSPFAVLRKTAGLYRRRARYGIG